MRELVLSCPEAEAESLSDILLDIGVLAVSVEDADSDTHTETPLYGEPGLEPSVQAWRNNRVVALLPDGLDPAQVLEQMADLSGAPVAEGQWQVREVPDEDWVRLTQSQFGPIQVGARIWIIPSWHANDPEITANHASHSGAIRIELDPGLAFGTGSHPTTHLCLEWLADSLPSGATVLDYGCGSGILAIAASMLGAASVDAVDIDEQAVQSTRDNALNNQVSVNACLPDALGEGQFEVVVANILSNPLKVLAPMLANRVAPGGSLVLSGVLERQAEEVAAAYEPWLQMEVWRARDGWVCLHGRRPTV
ncbi:50S ribosomal protein L11 methyltransferase [Achromobacter sp. F4_2707]|uniref:50S ribosomal protein L11 methyltransferase n=1 Tax=Achromobacter sp. F4_2707 TaxID=3114286 RepID=UPI0039C6780E